MWGSYVEGELEKVTREAKNNKEAERKGQLTLRKLLREDEDEYRKNADKDADGKPVMTPPKQAFRDPASVIRTG